MSPRLQYLFMRIVVELLRRILNVVLDIKMKMSANCREPYNKVHTRWDEEFDNLMQKERE